MLQILLEKILRFCKKKYFKFFFVGAKLFANKYKVHLNIYP